MQWAGYNFMAVFSISASPARAAASERFLGISSFCGARLERGQTAPVTFHKGSRRRLAARNPSPPDDPRRSANSAWVPRHPRATPPAAPGHLATRAGALASLGHPVANSCPRASGQPQLSLRARCRPRALEPPRRRSDTAMGMEESPLGFPRAGPCRQHVGTSPLRLPGPSVARGDTAPATPEDAPAALLQRHACTPVFTVLIFQIGLNVLNLQTLRSEHQGLISTRSQHMDTKI